MSDMDYARYQMMVEECATETQIVEYRDRDNRLVAAALIDVLMDGYSMVYSYFDPEEREPWLYLGYWVKESTKMDYKARYKPCQILGVYGWQELGKDDEA